MRMISCAIVVALCATGCGGSGKTPPPKYVLDGSLTELMDLGYDEAVLTETIDDISVRFVRKLGASEESVLKVSMSLLDLMLVAGTEVDLTEGLSTGAQRGVISRNVTNDPRTLFPDLQRGTLLLRSIPMQGQRTRGEFRVTFINGIQPACGHTAYGSFEATNP